MATGCWSSGRMSSCRLSLISSSENFSTSRPSLSIAPQFLGGQDVIIARLPRLGVPMILYEFEKGKARPVRLQHDATQGAAHAQEARAAGALHLRCLPARWHDGAGRS